MKILHIAHDHDAAELVARAVQGLAPDVELTWAQTPASALQWLDGNRDAAAVVVEVHAQHCASFVAQVRALGLTTPIVVIAGSGHLEPALAALNGGVDGYVVAAPSLEADLPGVVALAVGRERSRRELWLGPLTALGAERDRAEQRLASAEEARRRQEERHASELAAAAQRLADVHAEHKASLSRETRVCTALQQRLFELERAVRAAEERGASEAVALADQLAKRHAEFTASLAHVTQSRDTLAARLTAATAALDEAQHARREDGAAAAEKLRRREAELGVAMADAAATRASLEAALADAQALHRDALRRAEQEIAAATERQAALEDLLVQEVDRRTDLEQKLVAAEAAHQETDQRHVTELTRAAVQLAELQARHEVALTRHAAARAALEQQLTEAATAQRHTERQAADSAAAAAAREAELAERLISEAGARIALDRDLAGLRQESARSQRRLLHALFTHRQRNRTQTARFEARLAAQQNEADGDRRVQDAEIRRLEQDHETVGSLLATTKDRQNRLQHAFDAEQLAHQQTRLASEAELRRVSAEYDHLHATFDALQASFQTLETVAAEHAAERGRLESVVAERDAELDARTERHLAAQEAAHDAFARVEGNLRQALDASGSEVARLQQESDVLRRQLDAARTDAEMLRTDAKRLPDLQAQLELSQRERRREFERAPYALCRCTPTGDITDANHWFVTMLGRRRVDELRGMNFAAAVFDSAGDLGWLLERARTVRKTETIETRWRTKDGRGLTVRLQAISAATGSVDIVVEDITDLRALEERLRQGQRMEAVGRLAAEVAVTCDGLLRDVSRDAQDWLDAIGGDDALRRRGERLVSDVARAAGFLRQLGAYGEEQARALEPVSVQRVLRHLTPVLKRVVGDRIELVMPRSSGSFDVDVEAERLERVLVNVAGYARQRMPRGGQVKIDLETTDVGRRFVARYPNVRPGHHVLITVTELPGGAGEAADVSDAESVPSDAPGVDLGALMDLIGSCGGHLWMEAQPAGNLMVRMHLPRPARSSSAAETPLPDAPSERGGRLLRWFRSASAMTGLFI